MAIKTVTKPVLKVKPSPAVIKCGAKEKFEFEADIEGTAEADGTGNTPGTISPYDHDQPDKDPSKKQKKDKDTGAPEFLPVTGGGAGLPVDTKEVDKDGKFKKTKAIAFELHCDDNCHISNFAAGVSKAKVFIRVKFQTPNGKWKYEDSAAVTVECQKGS